MYRKFTVSLLEKKKKTIEPKIKLKFCHIVLKFILQDPKKYTFMYKS